MLELFMFSIIIPNYNGKKFLESSLGSIFKQKGKIKKEVIVVDNGSADGSVEWLKRPTAPTFRGEKLKVIFNKKNLGFAKAVNQGIKQAKYDYLIVMNNDLKLEKNWLQIMEKAIKRWSKKEKIGAYFGKVLDWEGKRLESAGLVYFSSGKAFNRGNGEPIKKRKYNQEEVIWGGSASVIVYRKEALKKVGLFDPLFFAYLEDVDLALRLNASGFKTVFVPQALSYHKGGGTADLTSNLRYRLVARNWWFIILKHYSANYLFRHLPGIVLEQFKNFLKVGNLSGMIWVVRELVLKCPKLIKKRKPLF